MNDKVMERKNNAQNAMEILPSKESSHLTIHSLS
jgi:hypothetical protein